MNRLMLGLLCAALLAHAPVSGQSPQRPANPAQPANPTQPAVPVQPASPAEATQPLQAICAAPEYRQFDFLIGAWVVFDDAGKELGRTEVKRADDGCGVREQWTGTDNSSGKNVNYYDPKDGKWHQDGAGSGLTLRLTGGLDGRAMIMSGERNTPQGRVADRITWTPLADGRVSQQWELSTDGGKTWKTGFLGYYTRR